MKYVAYSHNVKICNSYFMQFLIIFFIVDYTKFLRQIILKLYTSCSNKFEFLVDKIQHISIDLILL